MMNRRKYWKTGIVNGGVCAAIVLLLVGCRVMDEPLSIDNMPTAKVTMGGEKALVADHSDPTLQKRFADGTTPGSTDSALVWSQKFEEILKKQQEQAQKNQELLVENSDIKQRLEKTQTELSTTKKELDEANIFLQDMHRELTQWKADVLGFREEIRAAESAQMQALIRILKVLGAESSDLPNLLPGKTSPPAINPASVPQPTAPAGKTAESSVQPQSQPQPSK
jgi:hypothetical protein